MPVDAEDVALFNAATVVTVRNGHKAVVKCSHSNTRPASKTLYSANSVVQFSTILIYSLAYYITIA